MPTSSVWKDQQMAPPAQVCSTVVVAVRSYGCSQFLVVKLRSRVASQWLLDLLAGLPTRGAAGFDSRPNEKEEGQEKREKESGRPRLVH